MKKMYISNVAFLTHNKREDMLFNHIAREVSILRDYINHPDTALIKYKQPERDTIIKFRLTTLNGLLSACFWCDVLKEPISVYSVVNFNQYFNC